MVKERAKEQKHAVTQQIDPILALEKTINLDPVINLEKIIDFDNLQRDIDALRSELSVAKQVADLRQRRIETLEEEKEQLRERLEEQAEQLRAQQKYPQDNLVITGDQLRRLSPRELNVLREIVEQGPRYPRPEPIPRYGIQFPIPEPGPRFPGLNPAPSSNPKPLYWYPKGSKVNIKTFESAKADNADALSNLEQVKPRRSGTICICGDPKCRTGPFVEVS